MKGEQGGARARVCVCVCMCIYTCVRIYIYTEREKETSKTKARESKPAQQISSRSKSRCLTPSPEQDYLKSEIYEARSFMGLLSRSVHPPGKHSLPPSCFTRCIPKRGQEPGTGPRPALADAPLCNRDGRTNQGKERRCPHPRVPGMERSRVRKSPASPANATHAPCSALKVGTLYS